MSDKNENLKELLGKFYDPAQAKSAAEDVEQGEKLFADNPTPQPDAQLLESIKAQVHQKLEQRASHSTIKVYLKAMAAVAAAVIISIFVLQTPINKFQNAPPVVRGPLIPWESDDLVKDDADLSLLVAQVEELEDEIISLKLSENGTDTYSVDELEIELTEINSDFWKG